MTIERASDADVPRLAELLGALFEQEAEFTPDRPAQERGLRMILNAPDIGRLMIARDEAGTIVGMTTLLFSISTALGARCATVDDLVVAPAARGNGIGSRLLSAAIEQATAAGCARMELMTDHDNLAAQRLYARHGFERSTMVKMQRAVTFNAQGRT